MPLCLPDDGRLTAFEGLRRKNMVSLLVRCAASAFNNTIIRQHWRMSEFGDVRLCELTLAVGHRWPDPTFAGSCAASILT